MFDPNMLVGRAKARSKLPLCPFYSYPKSLQPQSLWLIRLSPSDCDHVPLYRQESIWQRMEIDMPRSSLCGWVLKTAELCEPLVRLLQKAIIAYDYAAADETTVQVMAEVGRSNTAQSYMWCYRGGGDLVSIVYDYQETRRGSHAQQFLAGFKGFLQTDAYAGYNGVGNQDEIIQVGCHAHGRRPFAELAKLSKSPGLAHDGQVQQL